MTVNNLNQYIDQTLLKADASLLAIKQIIEEAKTYQFKAICINPCHVKFCVTELKNTDIKVCTVIGFPLGANSTSTKVFETQKAIADGAKEIDVVINVGALKDNNQHLILEELKKIRQECPNVILKVIIETALLTKAEKITACKLVSKANADFIKTSTGFASKGATVEDVRLLKKYISKNVAIKVSGGIKTQEQALAFIEAGALRIGTSNGVSIVSNVEGKNEY
ncbi:MAG: deoxyribose-phosphate aldolase [Spiroplasma sp.]